MNASHAAVLLLPYLACSAMAAESYPVRPIRLVVGYPPGGADDAHGRLLGEKLTELLGRQVIIDNRGEAAGLIGQDIVAKAAPDGYTFLIAGSPIVIKPIFYPKMPYDLMRDLTPVSQLVSTRFGHNGRRRSAGLRNDELIRAVRTGRDFTRHRLAAQRGRREVGGLTGGAGASVQARLGGGLVDPRSDVAAAPQ